MGLKSSAGQAAKFDGSQKHRSSRRGRFTVPALDNPPALPDTFTQNASSNVGNRINILANTSEVAEESTADSQVSNAITQSVEASATPSSNSAAADLSQAQESQTGACKSQTSSPLTTSSSTKDHAKPKANLRLVVKSNVKPLPTSAQGTKQTSDPTLPTPHPSRSPPPLTSNHDELSDLSSVPESIGSTPEKLQSRQTRQTTKKLRDGSTSSSFMRLRERSARIRSTSDGQPVSKKRKTLKQADIDVESSDEILSHQSSSVDDLDLGLSPELRSPTLDRTEQQRTTTAVRSDNNADATFSPQINGHSAPRKDLGQISTTSLSLSDKQVTSQSSLVKQRIKFEKTRHKSDSTNTTDDLASHQPTSGKASTEANHNRPNMYGSDAQTQHSAGPTTEPARRGGKSNGRGGARTSRGGSSNGKGRGSKAHGKGRGEDSPDPSQPRKMQSQEDAIIIKHAKARQTELRKFFNIISNQQAEILDIISARDLSRLARKARTHKQVPEHEEIVEQLETGRDSQQDLVRTKYEIALEAETRVYNAEKAAIENRYKSKISDLQDEYRKGAQGDLIIFRRAIAVAHDDTWTQDGSEADYFPHYHDFPEPDQTVRGYTSTRITDEKPFKHHLYTYDDEARREVIDDDVGPIIQAFAQKNAERRAEEERKKTQTIEALSKEATKQLEEIRENQNPKPQPSQEDANSFALSCLADVSEWMAQQYPAKQYPYVPLEKRNMFPQEALTYDRFPGHRPQITQPQPLQPLEIPLPPRRNTPSKENSGPSAQPTRRSLRNIQPNGPVAQPQPPVVNPVYIPPTSGVSSGTGPALAPAPPKLAPAPPAHTSSTRPSPVDKKQLIPTPPEQSPVQPPLNQSPMHSTHGLPPLQPRHMSQSSLPAPPPPPQYSYGQPYSPTHPPQGYGPPPHQGAPSPYQTVPQPSPYAHHQHSVPPSPYSQGAPSPYHQHQYGPPPYYSTSLPPPPPTQQQYSFMPPQQGPAPAQPSPASRPHSRTRSNVAPLPPLQPPPIGQPQLSPTDPYYQNGYHNHTRTLSHPFIAQQQPPPPQISPQSALPPPPPPHQQPPPAPPPHTTGPAKTRVRAKANQGMQFVNQTLATRKAAAEQLAKEEAAAAAEKKERDKDRDKGAKGNGNGRKLAPKA